MDREIKFRRVHFIDKEKTIFSHIDYRWFKVDNRLDNTAFTSPSSNNFALYNIDYQYTWLKDKNWVEIYEGDIIKCTSWCPHEVIFKLDHWWNVLWWMPTFYLSWMGAWYQRTWDEEFICNIYQNPELLSEK